jgi:hypothetical protein
MSGSTGVERGRWRRVDAVAAAVGLVPALAGAAVVWSGFAPGGVALIIAGFAAGAWIYRAHALWLRMEFLGDLDAADESESETDGVEILWIGQAEDPDGTPGR